MKNHSPLACLGLLALFPAAATAQLTWEPVDPGGNGLWDTLTENWDSGGDNYVVWDNAGATPAVFPDFGAAFVVDIADNGVTVGDLTVAPGTGKLQLKSVTDNLGVITIKSGGATWNTGGREIEFLNNQGNASNAAGIDTPLSIASGDTLTIAGGGVFDTGEKPAGANWSAAGATLDVVDPTVVRGNAGSVSQFSLVKLVAGSSYIMERNSNQNVNNPFEFTGTGQVTFDNRWNGRTVWVNGVLSGTGGIAVSGMNTANAGGSGFLRINNTANSFSGGLMVDGSLNPTMVLAIGGDGVFGATPAAFDPDNIILKDGGRLRLQGGITLDANRGVTLDGGGTFILNGNGNTLNAPITGTGDLTIGVAQDSSGNALNLAVAGSDYTGDTNIVRGTLAPAVDNALPAGTIVRLGHGVGGLGTTTSVFQLAGTTQTIGGLTTTGGNTRELRNSSATAATLIIDVADTETYGYGSNIGTSAGPINFVKEGPGTQNFNRVANFTTDPGDVAVNEGTLRWNVKGTCGALTVNDGGTLILGQSGTAASFTAAAGSTTSFSWVATDWAGTTAGTDWDLFATTGDFTISAAPPSFTVVINDANLTNFTDTNASFTIGTVGGTMGAVDADFTVDQSAFTLGAGTFSVAVSGQDLVLSYATTGDAYDSWAGSFGLAGNFDDDDDLDGTDNGLEFILGSNPANGTSSGLPTPSTSATDFIFTFDRNDDAVAISTLTFQWGTDLEAWNDVPVAGMSSPADGNGVVVTVSDNGATDEIVVTVPRTNAPDGRIFGRLTATRP